MWFSSGVPVNYNPMQALSSLSVLNILLQSRQFICRTFIYLLKNLQLSLQK